MTEYTKLIELVVNDITRVITIPNNNIVLGVVGDIEVNKLMFKMPRYYCGFDMSEFTPKINYVTPNAEGNYYKSELEVTDDVITFTWLLTSDVTEHNGTVKFSISLYKKENGRVSKVFNSRSSVGNVLEGLNVDAYVTPEQQQTILDRLETEIREDIQSFVTEKEASINQQITEKSDAAIKAIDAKKNDVLSTISEDQYIQKIEQNAANVGSLREDIVCVNNSIGSLKDKLVIVGETLGGNLGEFTPNPGRAFVPFLRSGCTISAINGKIAIVYDNYSDGVREYISQDGSVLSEASFYSSIIIPETLKVNGVILYVIYRKSDDSIVSEEDVRNNVIIANGGHEGVVIEDGFSYFLTNSGYKLFYYQNQNRAVINGHLPESVRYVNARNGYQFLLISEQGEYINSLGNTGIEWMSSVDIHSIRQNYQGKIFMQFKKGDGNEPVSGVQNNIDFLSNNTERIMSVVVAASNSSDYDKKRADFVCSGVNDEVMIQSAVDSLKFGGTVYLANGDYNIDGWNHKAEITTNETYTAFFAIGVTDRNQQTISIKGYTPPMRKVDAKDIVGTAVLHVTPTAMDYINEDTYVGNVIGYVGVDGNDRKYPKFALEIENLGIQMIDNQHAVRGINAELFSSCRIKNVMIAVDSTGGTDDTSGYQIPNDKCTGIRGLCGSNMGVGYIIEQCFVWGMGVAYDINGEYLVMTQCGCRFCNIPYRFGYNNKTGVNCHDLTLINCCHEGCINGIVFTSNYKNQSINLYDYNMEILSSGKFAQAKKATESIPGNGRGMIRYTVTGDASNYNCYDDSFFEVGHGHNFDCVCSTSKRIGNTDEKPVASNYGNRFFDIKTGKDNIYLSDGWHEI